MKKEEFQENFTLAKESYESKNNILYLHYLFKCLKATDFEDKEEIKKINSMRKMAFNRMKLNKLGTIVSYHLYKNSLSFIDEEFGLQYLRFDKEEITEYRERYLFDFENNGQETELYKHLFNEGSFQELEFWIDYSLSFEPDDFYQVKHGMMSLMNMNNFKKALKISESIKFIADIEFLRYLCLLRLNRYKEIYKNVHSTNIDKNIRDVLFLKSIQNLYKNNHGYEREFKEKYIGRIKKHEDKVDYLESSPYISKYLKQKQKKIYHYTNINSIVGIIEKNELWATKVDYLNDYKETDYIFDIISNSELKDELLKNSILNALRRYFSKINSKYEGMSCGKEIDSFIDMQIENEYVKDAYVLSFSTNSDNLVLWGNYSSFKGYNICFEKEKLLSELSNKPFKEESWIILGGKIEYLDCKKKNNIISNLIEEIYSDFNEYNISEEILIKVIIAHIVILGSFIKNELMKSEDEFRILLIYAEEYSEKIPTQSIKIRDNSFVPFCKIKGNITSAMTKITIGPTNNIDTTEKGVNQMLKKYDIENVEVKKSEITLRY